ncbi:hypothetical protein A0J61_01781 [Choanephora cucurbitarum]|uniref:Uncharacterized protein n=1 Tax=Choanephora cucurbitarum TaxID=101091 RepID=A0A1C7NM05_9FUNG|nr:hypothetical protein A0J61_01781 [Choanephora cucurbitarum]
MASNDFIHTLQHIFCCRNVNGIDAHDSAPPSQPNETNQSTLAETPYILTDPDTNEELEDEDWEQQDQPAIAQPVYPYQEDFIHTDTEPEQAVLKEFEHANRPDEMEWFKTKINPEVIYSWKFDTDNDKSNNWESNVPAPVSNAPLEIITV